MKKILFILLLIGNFCYGQVTINLATDTVGTPSINTVYYQVGLVSFSLQPFKTNIDGKHLYLQLIGINGTVGGFGTVTFTNAGTHTWNLIARGGTSSVRYSLYACMPTSGAVWDEVSYNVSGLGADVEIASVYEITGVASGNNGANAIRQTVKDSANGADPTITMASLINNNGVLNFWLNDANPFGGTPESGWTENSDIGCATHVTGMYVMQRIGGADNTPLVTSSSSNWMGVSLELRGVRRITTIN